jgi:hypothetical protein
MLAKVFALALIVSPLCISAQTQVRVRVVDGRTGRPWIGKTVLILDRSKTPVEIVAKGKTTMDGSAMVSLDSSAIIYSIVPNARSCGKTSTRTNAHLWPVNAILSNGAVEENICNSKITAAPVPGEITIFVRHETLREFLDMN